MTLRGQAVEEEANCAKCLYVNRLFRRRPCVTESGEDGRKGCDEDMPMQVQERIGSTGRKIAMLPSCTPGVHSLLEDI